MFSKLLPTVTDLAPLLVVGSQAPLPEEARVAIDVLLLLAVVFGAWFITREVRPRRIRLLVLGSGSMAARLIEEIESSQHSHYVVTGVVDNEAPEDGSPCHARWLGTCDQLGEIVSRVQATRIVVAIENRRDRLPLQSLLESRASGVTVEDAIELYERLTGKMAIEALRPSTLFLSKGFRNHGAADTTARVVSVVIATVALVVVSPILLAIALLVKLDSRGPVLFVQPRAGRHGRPFGLLKFRTMHPCKERRSEWVVDNAFRITRVGKWLRRFRLDELPQFVNVLRGEMNLIGPRPHPVSNHATFMANIAYYGLRSTVRPGVTGWAQVKYGYANNLEEETEKMRYDLFYIKNRTLWLDVRILFESVSIVLLGHGSSEVRRPAPIRRDLSWPAARTAPTQVAYVPVLAETAAPAVAPRRQ
jgi:exopolysaccharide biosynthesis polyprenyl glycosylphosphotransferase